jgi:hypothetical protein
MVINRCFIKFKNGGVNCRFCRKDAERRRRDKTEDRQAAPKIEMLVYLCIKILYIVYLYTYTYLGFILRASLPRFVRLRIPGSWFLGV